MTDDSDQEQPSVEGAIAKVGYKHPPLQTRLAAVGFEVRSQIIWAKDRFALPSNTGRFLFNAAKNGNVSARIGLKSRGFAQSALHLLGQLNADKCSNQF